MDSKIETITQFAKGLLAQKQQVLIAIDGRCAAGKTTLALRLQGLWDCNVFHMDDFFLRPSQRTAQRLNEPGGNVDYERFLQEVLIPLRTGQPFSFYPYDCKTQELKEPVAVRSHCPVSIIEGSYSCHPSLWKYYDLHIFLIVDPTEQLRRIDMRNRANAKQFREQWIPLEENYFSTCQIEQQCELSF